MKKILCFIICFVLVLPLFVFTASAEGVGLVTQPTVFIAGDNEYNIVWVSDEVGAAFVELTADGTTYVYRDEKSGIIRTDDYIHTVRVPRAVLESAGKYTVITRTVFSNDSTGVQFDNEHRAEYLFKSYEKEADLTFAFLSDMHLKPAEFGRVDIAKKILDTKIKGVDVIVMNGDITDAMPTENYFSETLLEATHRLSGGSIPVVYVRGNHETRGEYGQHIRKYLAFETGEMYGAFSYGGVSAIVTDCGEDKADYRDEYGGMVDFENYTAKQMEWLKSMGGYAEGSWYNLGISHSPQLVIKDSKTAIETLMKYNTDIVVGGHYHSAQSYNYASYETVTDGGMTKNGYNSGALVFRDGGMDFNVYDENGEVVFTHSVPKKTETQVTVQDNIVTANSGVELSPLVSKSGGISSHALVGSKSTATQTVAPTVFDCGDTYNIVYMTDAGSSMTKGAAVVEKDGVSYTFTDSQAGNVMSDLLHSVSVPKSILEGATYYVKTTHLGSYGAYGEKISYDGITTDLGYTITSQKYKFPDFSDKDNLCILSLSDMKGGIADAVKIKNSLTITPDVIVVGGNMTDGLYSQNDFVKNILTFTQSVSGGEIPVIFTRGSGECYGDFAPYVSDFLRVTRGGISNGLYFATNYGSLNFIVCDTAGAYASNGYYIKQTEWLSRLTVKKGTKSFVVASDSEQAMALMGDSYTALGCIGVIGKSGDYGTVTVYDGGSVGSKNNIFAGTGDIEKQPVSATVSDERTAEPSVPSPAYRTDEQKQADIAADTENEAVVDKPTDLKWWTLQLYTWADRDIDVKNKKGELHSMNCAKALVAYANISGVDYSKLSGTNTQSKAIDWAYNTGIITYSPPMMHEFSLDEITALVTIK